jgi:hypothetical protein
MSKQTNKLKTVNAKPKIKSTKSSKQASIQASSRQVVQADRADVNTIIHQQANKPASQQTNKTNKQAIEATKQTSKQTKNKKTTSQTECESCDQQKQKHKITIAF